jgi:integrase
VPPRKRRPRGYIEELPSGSFRAVVFAGTDPLTKKHRYLRETAKTYAAAKVALTRLQGQVDDEMHPKTNITVSQAIDQWLDVAKLAETTRDRYEDLIRIYIRPTFGGLPAAKLDAEILERFYARLQRCRALCDGRTRRGHVCQPLSGSTVRQIHQIIRAAFERAVRWRHLGVNKAAFAVPPSPNRPAPDPPSPDEAARLLSAAWEDPDWGLLVWLTMITGRRRGEVSALRWSSVDFERAQLIVDRSNVQPRARIIEKETKSGSRPRIALDPHTMSLLEEHRGRMLARCAALGCELRGDAFLFSLSPDGSEPFKPRTISGRYRRMARQVGLRSTRFHALRHYSATELIAAGVDVRTVAGRLGQSGGGTTTLRVYAAWVSEADRRAAATMADLIPRPVVQPRQPSGPYADIAAELRGQIATGRLRPGDQLPTIVELAAAHSVSVGTAHRAIDLLHQDGLIEVSRGKRATVVQQL